MGAVLLAIFVVLMFRLLGSSGWLRSRRRPRWTREQQQENERWVAEHILQHPDSTQSLQRSYPKAAMRARAVVRYREIERLRACGALTEEDYDWELEKILPLVDISEDLTSV